METVAAEKTSTMKVVGRCVAGWLVGYLVSFVSSILYFVLSRIPAHAPASSKIMVLTAVYGVFFAALGAWVGAGFWRPQALGIGAAIAATIGIVAMWSWYRTPQDAHWTQAIAILLMASAAQFASLFRRED